MSRKPLRDSEQSPDLFGPEIHVTRDSGAWAPVRLVNHLRRSPTLTLAGSSFRPGPDVVCEVKRPFVESKSSPWPRRLLALVTASGGTGRARFSPTRLGLRTKAHLPTRRRIAYDCPPSSTADLRGDRLPPPLNARLRLRRSPADLRVSDITRHRGRFRSPCRAAGPREQTHVTGLRDDQRCES